MAGMLADRAGVERTPVSAMLGHKSQAMTDRHLSRVETTEPAETEE